MGGGGGGGEGGGAGREGGGGLEGPLQESKQQTDGRIEIACSSDMKREHDLTLFNLRRSIKTIKRIGLLKISDQINPCRSFNKIWILCSYLSGARMNTIKRKHHYFQI